jgi:hypothetical protein
MDHNVFLQSLKRRLKDELFHVLVEGSFGRKRNRRLRFELSGPTSRHQVVFGGAGDSSSSYLLDNLIEAKWVADNDMSMVLTFKLDKSKKATLHSHSPDRITIFFSSFLERELFGQSIEALRGSNMACTSDAEQWLDATTVRYITETVNALGRRSELLVDLDCSAGTLSFKDGSVRIPVHTISFIHNKNPNPRRVDLEWDPEEMTGADEEIVPESRGRSSSQLIADTLASLFTGKNKLVLRFKSATMREQFAGRLRAVQCGIDIIKDSSNPEKALEPVAKAIGEHLEIYCATWNVGDRPPPSDEQLLKYVPTPRAPNAWRARALSLSLPRRA